MNYMSYVGAKSSAVQVLTASKTGIPKLGPYLKALWVRREFAIEMSRANIQAQQVNTVIGQFWLVLNPLMLAGVYYVLVVIISGGKNQGADYFTHLLGGLFIYYFISGCMTSGAISITSAGRLITNTPFPRLLLPISAVLTSLYRFLPTIPVVIVALVAVGDGFKVTQLASIFALAIIIIFSMGLASIFATIQVYFRDTNSFLPFVNRIWLYISPVLFYPEQLPSQLQALAPLNPLYSLIGIWSDTLIRGVMPSLTIWITAILWAMISLVFGTLLFVSKESDFAVRL
jgi:ABC-type polysaccharide/polyol phosphate export permease